MAGRESFEMVMVFGVGVWFLGVEIKVKHTWHLTRKGKLNKTRKHPRGKRAFSM